MKKSACRVLSALFSLLFLFLCGCGSGGGNETITNGSGESSEESAVFQTVSSEESMYAPVNTEFMKAVWLSQYDLMSVYVQDGTQREKDSFTSLLETVLSNIRNDGYNTVMVQVRPFGDSFYPSELYPVSSYVSGAYGNEEIYDPFAVIVDLAHKHGLSVHAWLNPMRCMKPGEIVLVSDRYLIKQWYDDPQKSGDYITEVNGRLYLNPAHEEVRALIADGAREVCEKYDIDGVHIDDYFYPTTDPSFDDRSYECYTVNGGTLSLADFRRENINAMVREIYQAVKSADRSLLFGISPIGNMQISYTTLYTDVYKWCTSDGYIDYICPQIYFGMEHETFDFIKVYEMWSDIIDNPNVRLVVGVTLGKAYKGIDNYAGTGMYEWQEHDDILARCFAYLNKQTNCSGVCVFSYQYMYDALTGESIAETANERGHMKTALETLG